jgi:hypothetical protein
MEAQETRTPSRQRSKADSPAQRRRRSRYTRPRRYISWIGLILGLVIGVASGIFYAWNLAPIEEYDTAPWQLREADRASYAVAIVMAYEYDSNLARTVDKLVDLRLPGNDPIQGVANIACDLARSGYVDSTSGLRAIRSLMSFYQGQGKTGCADQLITLEQSQATPVVEVVLPTPTLIPPPTKTATPPGTPQATATPAESSFIPTTAPQRSYTLVATATFCDASISGVIEVRVVDWNNQPIPGQPIRVRWDGGSSTFFTGLKPERGLEYADFQMEAGRAYTIEMPGLSDPSRDPLVAAECFTEGGQRATRSYRVVFRGG